MKYLLFLLLLISGIAYGQTTYLIQADSTKLRRVGGNNELILENGTRGTTGVLVNYGNGRTRFSKPGIVGDTLFIGVDTILGVGAAGGSWNLLGNTGTNPATDFVGTVDNQPLHIKVNNVLVGFHGSYDVYMGPGAGSAMIAAYGNPGSGNIGIGESALANDLFGDNTAIGIFSQQYRIGTNNLHYRNTSVGAYSMRSDKTGTGNVAIGTFAMEGGYTLATRSNNNVAAGRDALRAIRSADGNVAIGWSSLLNDTTGWGNTAVGLATLLNTRGQYNIALGYLAGRDINTGSYNVVIGGLVATDITSSNNYMLFGDGQGFERFRINNNGAFAFDSTGDYGTSGDVLTSNGSGAAPTWEPPSGGGGGTPAGNFGNVQIGRNGAFATPASDSLDFESATGLSVKGNVNTTTKFVSAEGGGNILEGAGGAFIFNSAGSGYSNFGHGGMSTLYNGSGVFFLVTSSVLANIQAGGLSVGNSATAADASAIADFTSTTKGFLPPRMTATQASAIASPAEGLLVYVTNTNGTFTAKGWWGYNGAAWEKLNN